MGVKNLYFYSKKCGMNFMTKWNTYRYIKATLQIYCIATLRFSLSWSTDWVIPWLSSKKLFTTSGARFGLNKLLFTSIYFTYYFPLSLTIHALFFTCLVFSVKRTITSSVLVANVFYAVRVSYVIANPFPYRLIRHCFFFATFLFPTSLFLRFLLSP